MYKLENLAAMTSGRLAFAQVLMQADVSQRQQDFTNRSRESAELLLSDLVRIIEELKQRTKGGYDVDGEDEESDGSVDADDSDDDNTGDGDDDDLGAASQSNGKMGRSENDEAIATKSGHDASQIDRPIKEEPDEEPTKRKATDCEIPAAKRRWSGPASLSQASKGLLERRANIASLRAAAARFKQQASQREAKAYKLEAELFEEQAGEVD